MSKTMNVLGKNAIREVLKGSRKIEKIVICDTVNDNEIKSLAKSKKINIEFLPKRQFIAMYGDKNGGMVAVVDDYQYIELHNLIEKNQNKKESILLILDGLEDPHNLGAILRSVDATGCDGVIIPKNRSVRLNETVAKVSTGAIEHVDVAMVTNLNQTIDELKKAGYWVIGLELTGKIYYTEANYEGKIAIVVGSEGKGISPLVQKNCDTLVKIPMFGKVNSLNASVSTAIILYEAIRHRGINE